MNSNKFSLKSRFGSFKFAFNGLLLILKDEHNSRIHFLAAIVAIAMGIILGLNHYEWSLLIIVIGIVFLTELLNSSLESLADLIDPEWNELIMKAKDYSAAAVLISAIVAIVVGGLIFIPKILDLF
ncbi:MAG: diacylglycerol kinase family protein [Bacteroidales bacterium]|jgi:diacylglycerol kinase